MPRDSARAQLDDFVDDVKRVLALVSDFPYVVRRPTPRDAHVVEPLDGRAIGIRRTRNLWLGIYYQFAPKVDAFSTVCYRLTVQNVAENREMRKGSEWLVRWELHEGRSFPHIHVNGRTPKGWKLPNNQNVSDLHYPTSRPLIEDAVEFLIEEFKVCDKPEYEWRAVLKETRERFDKRRHWIFRPLD